MNGIELLEIISVIVLACIGTCILTYKLGYTDGWDARGDHEHSRRAARQLRQARAQDGIRAKTGPVRDGGAPSWYATVSRGRAVLAYPAVPHSALASTVPLSARRATPTGELRALTAATDLYIARVRTEGDVWREQAAAR